MLTKRQKEVLDFISSFEGKHGYAPTMREVAQALTLASPASAYKHIHALKEKGYLANKTRGWRAHAVTAKEEIGSSDFRTIAIIGSLALGSRIELFASISSHLLPKTILPHDATYYGFVIKDNSFSDQLLLTGDILIIDTTTAPLPAETVLMTTPGGSSMICEYMPQKKNVHIHGKIVLMLRTFR